MGVCNSSNNEKPAIKPASREPKSHEDEKLKSPKKTKEITEDEYNRVFNSLNEKFADMQIWDSQHFVGEGIKRDFAYKSSLKYDEISALRDEFFSSLANIDRDMIRAIKNACIADKGTYNYIYDR